MHDDDVSPAVSPYFPAAQLVHDVAPLPLQVPAEHMVPVALVVPGKHAYPADAEHDRVQGVVLPTSVLKVPTAQGVQVVEPEVAELYVPAGQIVPVERVDPAMHAYPAIVARHVPVQNLDVSPPEP